MKFKFYLCYQIFFFFAIQLLGQNPFIYKYQINLNEVNNDQLKVELSIDDLNEEELIFQFPAIVPGTYKVYNYGRFISDLKAFDTSGQPLSIKKIDDNRWRILSTKNISKISYLVDDTWDTKLPKKIFEPAGTNIDKDENFVLNNHGFFGYFDGMVENTFVLKVINNEKLYGVTSLSKEINTDSLDVYTAPSYHRLVDNPIMYSKPDTASIQVGNTIVKIGLRSPQKSITAKLISKELKKVLKAQQTFLKGDLPTNHYTFIIYLTDKPGVSGAMGALEHWNSSFYFLPTGKPKMIIPIIQEIAAHEFFHILTPLSIHSEEIAHFDYIEPKMSEHLWLYEGVTEYFAGLALVKNGVIDRTTYMNSIGKKILNSTKLYNRNIAFTTMSKGCLDKYGDQYPNVYEKGALIALGLDLVILEHSNGTQNLRDLMLKLSKKYGSDKPFKDEELFTVIGELSGIPETTTYLKKYVDSNTPLPLEEMMAKVGIDYAESREIATGTFGNIGISINDQDELFVEDLSDVDEFGKKMGYQLGDVLLKYNKQEITMENISDIINEVVNSPKKNTNIKVTVRRQGKIVKLKSKTVINHQTEDNIFEINGKRSPQALHLRELWLGKISDEKN
ncbi:peptidase M61 [Flammeovirga yaeyamensis]|uniref:Peptidase M61 n=1 Tax=Flammeovirga yaeyamensis TaxID=367791 RepID=A0AAX1N8J2_9BACT|nr:peptidase M61 [Flammeovirga yaeyamensis]MBB3698811.1 putative metalloprotease with PDZ domain [Flammeovirga yaeyamensis]NMF37396.1 peptidase M61 [Flammeovirga yaeyamensis]QWG03790.1 peptidase M61 [Flammeovirga yaeyamensis]